MDSLRGNFGALDTSSVDEMVEDDIGDEAPPPEIGQDERRMQVRVYNFWASLLQDRNYPNVGDLDPDNLPDFGPNGVLLDFSEGIEDPLISSLGSRLAEECGASGLEISRLSDVPARSLLSRITDHYMQILGNQAPIGFEAEFVNQRGATILYRGILLPFSSDDETIDYIYGVINWKELADSQSADELLLEIDQALDDSADRNRRRSQDMPMADWADGPGSIAANDVDDELPRPSFGFEPAEMEVAADDEVAEVPSPASSPMSLGDWLASARELAQTARSSEERTRKALYDAISRAYDFALAADDEPEEFAAMLEDAGLAMQDRAPMTPVVKLVFGKDYDKTRLTEYAAALTHARRMGMQCGELGAYLREATGGLKGIVQQERQQRRVENGQSEIVPAREPRKTIASRLRALEPRSFSAIGHEGSEFALVMVRRTASGDVVVLGEVPDDVSLVERAARSILG